MRGLIVVSLAGIALSGCASVPGLSFLNAAPPMTTLQLESMPSGADASTSAGPSCRTPCSVSVPAEPLTVTFTLDRHQPQTVPVQPRQQMVVNQNEDLTATTYVMELDPNPAYAELAPMAPPKRATKRPPPKRVAKQPPAAAPPPPPPPGTSPFPPPATSSPFPSPR
jgi:hypothetical protein